MKTLILMLIFGWTSITNSIDIQSYNKPGHWPMPHEQALLAVMPVNNHKIITVNLDYKNGQAEFDPQVEIFMASLAAVVGLAPHYLLGYHF